MDEKPQSAIVTGGAGLPAVPADVVEIARGLAEAARAPNTRRAYGKDWAAFEGWCLAMSLAALPAEPTTVALYVAERVKAGRRLATIARAVAAIGERHRAAGYPSPQEGKEVRAVMQGLRRSTAGPPDRAAPLLPSDLRKIVAVLPVSLSGARDRAMLLIGFAAALRRSELVALDHGDLAFVEEGLKIQIRRSKTDQEGEGAVVGVPAALDPDLCPVRALRRWLDAAAITAGPVFRSVRRRGEATELRLGGDDVSRIVRRAVALVGLAPGIYSAHSLRAGFATAAARAGRPEWMIQRHGRWRSDRVVRGYVRIADVFVSNAAAGLL